MIPDGEGVASIPLDAVTEAAHVLFRDAMSNDPMKREREIVDACVEVAQTMLEAAAPHLIAAAKAAALEEVAVHLDKPRVVWYDHQVGAQVMQKEGDYSSLVGLTDWLRGRVPSNREAAPDEVASARSFVLRKLQEGNG